MMRYLTSVCLTRLRVHRAYVDAHEDQNWHRGIAHVTRDSGINFKVKRSTCRGRGILWRPPA